MCTLGVDEHSERWDKINCLSFTEMRLNVKYGFLNPRFACESPFFSPCPFTSLVILCHPEKVTSYERTYFVDVISTWQHAPRSLWAAVQLHKTVKSRTRPRLTDEHLK